MGDIFRYLAKNVSGEYIDDKIEANTEDLALKLLESQGLYVLSIKEEPKASQQEAQASSTSDPQEQAAAPKVRPAAEHLGPSFNMPPEPVDQAKIKKQKWLLLGVLGIFGVLLLSVVRIECDHTPKDVSFDLLLRQDVNPGDPTSQIMNLAVQRGISIGGIKLAAKKAWEQESEKSRKMEQALIQFFYKDQNPKLNSPIAVLRYNWEQSGEWEYSFSLHKAEISEQKITAKQKLYKRDKYVVFEFITPKSLSAQGAQRLAKEKLKGMRYKWRDRVERIDAELIYKDFFSPFMTCSLKTSDGKITCKMNNK